jgi:hypothetical protein
MFFKKIKDIFYSLYKKRFKREKKVISFENKEIVTTNISKIKQLKK